MSRTNGRGAASEQTGLAPSLLHLAALSSLAVTQPLLDQLGAHPGFFVAQRMQPGVVLMLTALLALGPWVVLAAVEAICHVGSPNLRRAVHQAMVVGLVAIVCLPPLNRLVQIPFAAALMASLGGIASVAAYRHRFVKQLLAVYSVSLLLFPALFLLRPSMRSILFPGRDVQAAADVKVANPVPVVLVVFDELPITSLMDRDFRVDRQLFPNFARLAETSTWYRDTRTVALGTLQSVSSILTGRHLDPEGFVPSAEQNPDNLFTLLGRTYQAYAFESKTDLCPTGLCFDLRSNRPTPWRALRDAAADLSVVYGHLVVPTPWDARLPSISEAWSGFVVAKWPGADEVNIRYRELVFDTFVESIEDRRQPTLYFLHVVTPHVPWRYYPSGRTYDRWTFEMEPLTPGRSRVWLNNQQLVWHGFQRYMLQVQFVDRLVGVLLDKLESTGLLDDGLLIVTADHGVNFVPGKHRRSPPSLDQPWDVEMVPLFVKLPGQRSGTIEDSSRYTIDILPTIADVVGAEIPWRIDGISLLEGREPIEPDAPASVKFAMATKVFETFGSDPRARLYPDSVGSPWLERDVGEYDSGIEPGLDLILENPEPNRRGDRFVLAATGHVPGLVIGRIEGDEGALQGIEEVVIAVDGKVVSVPKTYVYPRSGQLKFAVVLPEDVFRIGVNDVRFFVADGDSSLKQLASRELPRQGG